MVVATQYRGIPRPLKALKSVSLYSSRSSAFLGPRQRMGRRRRPAFDPGAFEDIVDGTKRIYCEKVRPLEETYLVKVRAHTHIHSRMPQQPAPKATCHPTRAIGESAPAAPPIALRARSLSLLADRASSPSPHTDTSASAHRSAHTTRLRSAFSQDFHYPLLSESDFDAKPMVLLCGQYSTGKTSFIKFLLEREFPGMHFRPPTRFSHMSHPTFPRSHLLFFSRVPRNARGTRAHHRSLPGTSLLRRIPSPNTRP